MSKKVSVLQDEFNIVSNSVKSAISSGELNTINVSFPSICSAEQNITVGSTAESSTIKITKFNYKGILHNTYDAARQTRNRDIDSAIAKVSAKISKCESLKGKLNNLKSDCKSSRDNLERDQQKLKTLNKKFLNYQDKIIMLQTRYRRNAICLNKAFNCMPSGLDTEVTNAFDFMVSSDCSNTAISSAISKIGNYKKQAVDIITQIKSLENQLDSKKQSLALQRNKLSTMKT